MRRIWTAALLLVSLSAAGIAAERDDGSAAYREAAAAFAAAVTPEGFAAAARLYEKAALQGHPAAGRWYGHLCNFGIGVPQNTWKAAEWYGTAAGRGDVPAAVMAASMHMTGRGAFVCPLQPYRWLVQAMGALLDAGTGDPWAFGDDGNDARLPELLQPLAEGGDAGAMAACGVLAELGLGTERNGKRAREWFEAAAEAGDGPARMRLGILYRAGARGFSQDHDRAFLLFTQAAESGYSPASLEAGIYHYLMGNYDRASENFHAAAEAGSVTAAERNGTLLLGEGILEAAAEENETAARMGGPNAHLFLFVLHAGGNSAEPRYGSRPLERDMKRALEHLIQGLDAGGTELPPEEMFLPYFLPGPRGRPVEMTITDEDEALPGSDMLLGLAYQYGLGRERNPELAEKKLLAAAESGRPSACWLLARLYDTDGHWAEERGRAVEWYEKAAAGGYGWALFRLGMMHREGGLPGASEDRALEYFRRIEDARGIAARTGHQYVFQAAAARFAAVFPDAWIPDMIDR